MSRVLWFVLILTLVVTSCQASDSRLSPSESPLLNPTVVNSPLPAPATVDVATPIPPPQAGVCTVTGTLMRTQEKLPPEPMADALLFLAPLIYSADGKSTMANLNKGKDPVTVTDEAGRFVFPNVEPQTYALVYSAVTYEILIKRLGSNEDLLITAVSDQIIDLGETHIQLP